MTYKEEQRLRELYFKITENRGKPVDFYEITALLETNGLRDIDAKEIYQEENLFELAKKLQRFIDEKKDYKEKKIVVLEEIEQNTLKRYLKNYIRGLAFALPMLVQIIATLVLGYAIWSSLELTLEDATAISIGTLTSLVVSGGPAQAIGRKGLFYLKFKEYILARNVTVLIYSISFVAILILSLLALFFNFIFETFPPHFFYLALVFFIELSIFFLTLSIFYMFESYGIIVFITFLGMLLVYFFYRLMKISLPYAQEYALFFLDIATMIISGIKLYRLKYKNVLAEGDILPKPSALFYSLYPYFLYGFFYFSFLVIDRFISWSAGEQTPYFIWFIVPYELGLDWALVVLVFMMGVTEISIFEFMYEINIHVTKISYKDVDKFNRIVYNHYKKFNAFYFLYAVMIFIITFLAVYIPDKLFHFYFLRAFLLQPTISIFFAAGLAYILLVNSLMNILFMFSLSRHEVPVKYIRIAVIADIVLGIILSRAFGYPYAVLGLLAGSIIFWYGTFTFTRNMFKHLDYYYYSAY